MQLQEEVGHARETAALSGVVPQSGRSPFGDAARDKRLRAAANPVHPRGVACDLRETIEEPRDPDRSVAPAEIVERIFGRPWRVMVDTAAAVARVGDREQMLGAGERSRLEPEIARFPEQGGEEVRDARRAVGEIRHPRGTEVPAVNESDARVDCEIEQCRIAEHARGVEQGETDAGDAVEDVRAVAPQHATAHALRA